MVLGWVLDGGPLGALFGYLIGKSLDNNSAARLSDGSSSQGGRASSAHGPYRNTGTSNDLTLALMVLVSAVMRADGTVRQSELDYVKRFLLKNFGEEKAKDLLLVLRDLNKKDIQLGDVCRQIKVNTDYSTRYHLLDFLMGLATADNDLTSGEERVLQSIRVHLGITVGDYMSMLERHNLGGYRQQSYGSSSAGSRRSSAKDPYKVLGLDSSASDEEVRRAYRRFAMKYHPDKVEHLGEEMKKNAEEQFREINEAYETIKSARGMK